MIFEIISDQFYWEVQSTRLDINSVECRPYKKIIYKLYFVEYRIFKRRFTKRQCVPKGVKKVTGVLVKEFAKN